MKYIYFSLLILLISSCKKDETNASDELRPKFHFTNSNGSINNIIAYFDEFSDGRHLFYNNISRDSAQGKWKHAMKKYNDEWKQKHSNNFHWQNKRTILNNEYFNDGSIFKDKLNLSKLDPKAGETWIAVYSKKNKGILLTYSTDKGKNWARKRVILPNKENINYKYPRIEWISKIGWCIAASGNDHLAFFASKDLKSWRKINTIKFPSHKNGDYYEQPTFKQLLLYPFHLGPNPWVLMYSKKNDFTKKYETRYIVGKFDSINFKPYNQKSKQFSTGDDQGAFMYNDFRNIEEYYYGIIKNNTTEGYNFSSLTSKRRLEVNKVNGEHIVRAHIVGLPSFYKRGKKVALNDTLNIKNKSSFLIESKEKTIEKLTLTLENDFGEKLTIHLKDNRIIVDKSGLSSKNSTQKYTTDSIDRSKINSFTMYYDVSILEVTVNGGTKSINCFVNPDKPFTRIKINGNKKPFFFTEFREKEFKQ